MKSIGVVTVALATIAGLSVQVTAQPKPVIHTVKVEGCDGAVLWLDAHKHPGKSVTGYDEIQDELHSHDRPPFRQWTVVKWKYSLKKSSMILWVFAWENMSAADRAAVANYRRATLTHENGHHKEAKKFLQRERKRITGEGRTADEAAEAFHEKQKEYYADFEKRFSDLAPKYDDKTNGGNIKLICPKSAGRMVLPDDWGELFPGPGSVETGAANIQTALLALSSTEVGRNVMALGDRNFAQGACAGRVAIRATDPLSDRYVIAEHIQGHENGVVWPFRSSEDLEVLLRATSSFRETMGGVSRLTARVSATRISAPWTKGETLEGLASP